MHQDDSNIQEGLTNYVYLGTVVFLMLALLFIFFLVLSVRRRKRLSMEKEQLKTEFEKELLHTQLEIQEQTLKTISQEIHDNIGQALSLAKLNLNTMDAGNPGELQEKILNSKQLVGKAIQDLRDLSKSMNTDHISSMGLVKAVEFELDLIRRSGFKVLTDFSGEIRKMEPRRELILFRIIQETLNNVIRHADADMITVQLEYTTAFIELTISDNGKGFDKTGVEKTQSPGGLGLRNMESRARVIGATFNVESNPGNGTFVILKIPYTNPNKI